jgi:predicted RNA-binding Zn ribbon-like protein
MSGLIKDLQFQLVAAHPCLDFANSLDNRGSSNEIELIPTYAHLAQFAKQCGVFARDQMREVESLMRSFPQVADLQPVTAIKLREIIFTIFSGVAHGNAPLAATLEQFNEFVKTAAGHRALIAAENGFRWRWVDYKQEFKVLWFPFALAAADLLASDDLRYVRQCASSTCDWLFLDKSKSHSRRWCDMKVCGNRTKARKFYQRSKRRVELS